MGDETRGDEAAPGLRIFLSYARRDQPLVRRIAAALDARGFTPDFDQSERDPDNVDTGISAEDEWWARLQEMIAAAEVMVLVASPASAASLVCGEEIAYARALGKRVIAVLGEPLDFAAAPPRLAALNVKIDFTDAGPGFDAAIDQLARALNRDVGWHRRGARLAQAATDWDLAQRPDRRLLRAGAVEEAEDWAARRPADTPEPGALFFEFVNASKAKVRTDRRRLSWLQRIATTFVLAAAGFAVWGLFTASEGRREVARNISHLLTQASREALDGGDADRATRLAVIAARDSALSPAARGAPFQLGRAAAEHDAPLAVLPVRDASAVRLWPDGSAAATLTQGSHVPRVWRPDGEGVWRPERLVGHVYPVNDLDVSPDGRLVATAGQDAAVRVWSRDADGAWRSVSLAHDQEVNGVQFGADGAFLAAMASGTIWLWRRDDDGAWTPDVVNGGPDGFTARTLDLSDDGSRVLAVPPDRALDPVAVWIRGADGRWIKTAPAVNAFEAGLSPDGRRLAVLTSQDVLVFEWRDGVWARIARLADNAGFSHRAIDFDPTGGAIATIGAGTKVWPRAEWRDGGEAGFMVGYLTGVRFGWQGSRVAAAFSHAGDVAAAGGGRNAAVQRWVADRGIWDDRVLRGHDQQVHIATVSSDGSRAVTASYDDTVRIWDWRGATDFATERLTRADGEIRHLDVSADGTMLAAASAGGFADIWSKDPESGTWGLERLDAPGGEMRAVAIAPAGDAAVTASRNGFLFWRREPDGAWSWFVRKTEPRSAVYAEEPVDGLRAVTIADNEAGSTDWYRAAAYGPDGKRVALARHATIMVFDDVSSGDQADFDALFMNGAIHALTFDGSGDRLLAASQDDTRIWIRTEDGWVNEPVDSEAAMAAAFDPTRDDRVVIAGVRGALRIAERDPESGAWRSTTIGEFEAAVRGARRKRPEGVILDVDVSPDGRLIAAGFDSGEVMVFAEDEIGEWRPAELTGDRLLLLAHAVRFSPDGRTLFLGRSNGVVRRVDVSWLLDQQARSEILGVGDVVDQTCDDVIGARFRTLPDDVGATRVARPLAEVTPEDLEAAPILRALGVAPGFDVCAPPADRVDAVLSAALPRAWWSGLSAETDEEPSWIASLLERAGR